MLKKMMFAFAIIPGFLFAADLVKNGKPGAVIILGENASAPARLGAYEIQYHVKKITGAELPIAKEAPSGTGTRIFVGESPGTLRNGLKNADFKKQEYLVRIKGNDIFLLGFDGPDKRTVNYQDAGTFPDLWKDIGTLYAVYDFIELLGVRWYLPTELGTTFIPSGDLAVQDTEIRRVPSMEMRKMYENEPSRIPADLCGDTVPNPNTAMLNLRDTKLWFLRSRAGGRFEIINHSLGTLLPRFKEKRDWFAQGYEIQPFMQLCYTNPEVIAQVAQDARDFFDGKVPGNRVMGHATPDYKSDVFTVFPMDNGDFCKCSRCAKYIPTAAGRGAGLFSNDKSSNFFFRFVNEVAKQVKKTHPDKLIATGAYSNYAYPPTDFKLEDNIMVMMCLHVRGVYSKKVAENDERIVRAWQKEYPDMKKYVWLYYCFPTGAALRNKTRCFPGFFGSHVKDYFKYLKEARVSGMFWEPAALVNRQKSVLFDQVEGYINWKLAFDSSLDADQLFDEFFRRYYGPAEKPMKEFYKLAESIYCDPANYPSHAGNAWESYPVTRLATEERMTKLSSYLAQAKAMHLPEPFQSRMELFDCGVWQYIVKGRKDALENRSKTPCMQQAPVPCLKNPEPGNPLKIDWNKACALNMYGGLRAEPLARSISVRAAHDGEWLYFRYLEHINPDTLKKNASSPYENDEWESYFAGQRDVPYRQIGVDANGKIAGIVRKGIGFENWTFPGKVQCTFNANTWTTYIAVKMSDMIDGGVRPGDTLYYNLIRSASGYKPVACWIPTFGGYHAPERFGELYIEPEK